MKRLLENKLWACLFILPAAVVYIAALLVPIIWSVTNSFFSWNGLGGKDFVGLSNYIRLLTNDSIFVTAFTNNLVYTAVNIAMQLGGGLLLALFLLSLGKGKNLFRTLYYAPVVISTIALSEVLLKFFASDPPGIVNSALGLINPDWEKLVWFGDFKKALPMVSIAEGYKNMPVYMVILYSALISIPEELKEAARIDGAHGVSMFRYITFPLIRNMVFTCLILIANYTLKSFDFAFQTTYGGPGAASELMATYMYKQAFVSIDYGYASVLAVFMGLESVLVVGVIRYLHNRHQERVGAL